MENADGIPTWNMLKKEDLQNVLGLHNCNIIPTGPDSSNEPKEVEETKCSKSAQKLKSMSLQPKKSQQKKREEEAWYEKKWQEREKYQNPICDEPMSIRMDTCAIWKFFWTICHEFE
ncbi:hypothetical protein AVEN_196822-1 [Araneus ventricosus]|uniref:Uncharacterized protein n=1 Tax=Araneus ventricosus TaxID=182803 RepID=A0A4Y2JGG9_ARAVE|nr:hypothetical protein AVEN_196822-1 [Araneus ventricosus]